MFWALLAVIGLLVGAFGTLIGAAGAFILVPILLFLHPGETPSTITSMTLIVAFSNAFSGSIAYGRLRRIDYRSGLLFSLTGVPGAVIGAYVTGFLNRGVFQDIFGATLLIVAVYLMVRPEKKTKHSAACGTTRRIIDRQSRVYTYSFSRPTGMAIAFGVGVVSGLLGIGGGIIHVPALTQLLCFPIHIATATSHFVVATTTLAAIGVHITSGAFFHGLSEALVLSAGAVVGAQIGAVFSERVSGAIIIRLLALGLAIVALRLIVAPF